MTSYLYNRISSALQKTDIVFPLLWKDYGVSVSFLRNWFLVTQVNRTLKLDTLSMTEQWKEANVLIFNSNHWWLHTGKLQTWVRIIIHLESSDIYWFVWQSSHCYIVQWTFNAFVYIVFCISDGTTIKLVTKQSKKKTWIVWQHTKQPWLLGLIG